MADRVKQLERELADLRKKYAGDPHNYQLGYETGLKEQQWRAYAVAEKKEAEKAAARAEHVAWQEEYRNRPQFDSQEFADLVPEKCPGCARKLHGYFERLGDYTFRCRHEDCKFEDKVW